MFFLPSSLFLLDLHASTLLQLSKRTEAHSQDPLHSAHLCLRLLAQPSFLHQRGVLCVLWHGPRLLRRWVDRGRQCNEHVHLHFLFAVWVACCHIWHTACQRWPQSREWVLCASVFVFWFPVEKGCEDLCAVIPQWQMAFAVSSFTEVAIFVLMSLSWPVEIAGEGGGGYLATVWKRANPWEDLKSISLVRR